MGWFDSFRYKTDNEAAEKIIREYVNVQFPAFIANWKGLMEDLGSFGEIDKKSLLKDELSILKQDAVQVLKANRIKVPAHAHQIVRDEFNQRIMEPIKKLVADFVIQYRKPYQPWPNETDIPMKDMEKLRNLLKENDLFLDLLDYDLSEEKIRGMLQQYGLRKKPEFQSAETWSKNFTYSYDDIINLGLVLQSKNIRIQAIEHGLGDLRLIAKKELLEQQDQQFERSLRKANPTLLQNPSKKEWVAAYVNALRTDLDYLPYLIRIALRRGTAFEKTELEDMVRAELKKRNLIHD